MKGLLEEKVVLIISFLNLKEKQLSETTKSSQPTEENTTEESNVKKKDKGEGLAGGESSADHFISESEGENKDS